VEPDSLKDSNSSKRILRRGEYLRGNKVEVQPNGGAWGRAREKGEYKEKESLQRSKALAIEGGRSQGSAYYLLGERVADTRSAVRRNEIREVNCEK